MKKITLFFILFQAGLGAFAQSDYLVTLKSDTIKGELRILSYDQLDRVQISNNGKKEMYTALQVLILNKDNEFYKAVQIDNSIRLMKIIKRGYLSLYGFKHPNQSSFEGRYLVKLNGTSMEMPNLGFKKIMSTYLEDCYELSERVKNGDIGKGKIEEIVDQYNVCLSNAKPADTPVAATVAVPGEDSLDKTQQIEAVQNLMNKIKETDFPSKEDALDILRDIESKVTKNESIANYLIDGLQSMLKDQPTLSEELEKVIGLLKK